ncbi:aspartate dehydrogenase domain-containing protein isoform X1 [Carettochelys insculpta]|uniref:aspartate dehydrogenase domain-containing protein isoform X1 n=1 Tax=Carettochelys insculpta TaxID=44489 RepID=UPI003EBB8E7C
MDTWASIWCRDCRTRDPSMAWNLPSSGTGTHRSCRGRCQRPSSCGTWLGSPRGERSPPPSRAAGPSPREPLGPAPAQHGQCQGECPSAPAVSSPCSAVHLLVEVAHPCIARDHGEAFLSGADFMVGSPTALADPATEARLREAAQRGGHTLYVPRGALWGGEDIQRMDERGLLQGLKVTMVKHPESFRLAGALGERLRVARAGRAVLYEGPVRDLCPLAPNNVNTMAAACVAAPSLGFDGVRACLVADPSLPDWHVVEVEVTGRPTGERGDQAFTVTSSRRNPASPGAVTGAATFPSFWGSLLACRGHGGQVLLC